MDDDFLADAMEGISQSPEGKHEAKLAALRNKIEQRTQRKRGGFLSIAAAMAMLIVAGGAFWTVNKKSKDVTMAGKSMAYEPAIEKEEIATITADIKINAVQERDENKITTISLEDASTSFDYIATKEIVTSPPKTIVLKKRKDIFEAAKAKAEALTIAEIPVTDDTELAYEEVVGLNGNAQAPIEVEAVSGFTLEELDTELDMDSITTSQPEQKYIVGTVRSSNQEPLIGVNIQVAGTDITTISNFEGQFKLKWGVDIDVLEFSYLGFEKTITSITGPGKLEVMMDESAQELSEVVVTTDQITRIKASKSSLGTGQTKKVRSPALVISSYRKFERYVRRNKIHFKNANGEEIKGSVHLQFTVQANGKVSDITIVNSTDATLNAEAIRLLENGPKWKNDAGMVQLREYVLVFE